MTSIREQLIKRFGVNRPKRGADEELGDALYALLYSTDLNSISPDGWEYFGVIAESERSLSAVGFMTLLPTGNVPIQVSLECVGGQLSWLAEVGRIDSRWLQLSDSKRWNAVYLYATGGRDAPQWEWEGQYRGSESATDV